MVQTGKIFQNSFVFMLLPYMDISTNQLARVMADTEKEAPVKTPEKTEKKKKTRVPKVPESILKTRKTLEAGIGREEEGQNYRS